MITAHINRPARCPLSDALIKKISAVTASIESKVKGEVEITFVSKKTIQSMNLARRGIDAPTDVLSFSWQEDARIPSPYLGELYLSYDYIVPQAKRFKVSAKEETVRMITHGLLHLAGHDHHKPSEAKRMFALQEKVVTKIMKH